MKTMLLVLAAVAGCATNDDNGGGAGLVTGEIRGAPFAMKMAARIVNDDPNSSSDAEVYRFADFDVCSNPGIMPSTTYLDVYVPKAKAPGTFAVSHGDYATDVEISMQRADASCDTQGEYANMGTATIDNGDYTFLRGTIDGARESDHVNGSFAVTCSIHSSDSERCLPP